MEMRRLRRPRCFLVYALAPEDMAPGRANQIFNAFVGDRSLPLVLFHDHFIGHPGGLAIFYAGSEPERAALKDSEQLEGWQVDVRPLTYSRSPAGFDEQISFTIRSYRGRSWEQLRHQRRPDRGDPQADPGPPD